MASIEDEARAKGTSEYPHRNVYLEGSAYMSEERSRKPLRDAFARGYIAGANRAQETTGGVSGGRGGYVEAPEPPRRHDPDPIRVQIASRKGGKNSTLADLIVERANGRGIQVEFVEPDRAQEATRERVAEAMLDTPAVDFPGVHFASSNPEDVKDAEGLADALLARFTITEKETGA